MTSRDFCFWLQGWFELNKTIDQREGATKETMKIIEEHLGLVFNHEFGGTKENPDRIAGIGAWPTITAAPTSTIC